MEEVLFILDVDGTLWESNIISRTMYKMYEQGLFDGVILGSEDLQDILMEIYFRGRRYLYNNGKNAEISIENSSIFMYHLMTDVFSKYFRNAEYLTKIYFETLKETEKEMKLYEDAMYFLNRINFGKKVIWTDGYHYTTIRLLKSKLQNYDKIFNEELYPEKLYSLGFSNPFKPNKEVVVWLIERYKPQVVFVIGDHPYYDGFIIKGMNNKLKGKSIIVYRKNKDFQNLLNDYWKCIMVRKYADEIKKMSHNHEMIVANSFYEAINLIENLIGKKAMYNNWSL